MNFIYNKIILKIFNFYLFWKILLFNPIISIRFMKNNPGWNFLGLRLHIYGEKTLHEIVPLLTRLKINVFLSGGTLLGYYRDNNFIKHDDDLDFGLFEDDIKKMDLLKDELQKLGWVYRKDWSWKGMSFEKPKYDYFNIDFYYYFRQGDDYIASPTFGDEKDYWPADIFTKMTPIVFFGENLTIPGKIEKYLERVYGKNWKIPKSRGSYTYAHKEVRK